MQKLMLAVAMVMAFEVLRAQEMGSEPVCEKKVIADSASAAGTSTLEAAAAVAEDGGEAIVAIAEKKSKDIAAIIEEPGESALDKVNRDLDAMGLTPGYDSDRKAIIQVSSADIEMSDPANDASFMLKREQIGNYAILQAKAEVIRAIYSEFSAMDRALTNFDEENDDNREKFTQAKNALESKRGELAEAMAKINAADAKTVGEVTLNDRFGSFLDAVIKKIDTSYDPATIAASKKIDVAAAKLEADTLKAKARDLHAEYKALEEAADKLPKDPVLATESSATLLSKMPLLGAAILTQAESWDPIDKQYRVAVAIVWSPKLQMCAARIGTGDFTVAGKRGSFTTREWVKAQDWSSMIGTRRFTDSKGNNYFVGIGAVEPGLGIQANAKRMLAETLARKNVAMALIGDLAAYREIKQNLNVYADQTTATKQKIVDDISSKVDLQLKGCTSIAKKEVRHPITGKKIYVCAYCIDPSLAAEAGDIMKNAFAEAGLVAQHANRQRGFVAGARKAYEEVKTDPVAYRKGVSDGAAAVRGQIDVEKRAAGEKEVKSKIVRAGADKASPHKESAASGARAEANETGTESAGGAVSTGGTYSGGTIDTDF